LILVLALPIIVVANQVDPTWIPGLYDDADTDDLVLQIMSPEAMLLLDVIVLVWLMSSMYLAARVAGERAGIESPQPVPRGPPGLSTHLRSSALPVHVLASASLNHPAISLRPMGSIRQLSGRAAPGCPFVWVLLRLLCGDALGGASYESQVPVHELER
jgi:hypothetical protein